ncbi:FHA domain-containing protein [Salinibacter ruber]|uniref:FHA domain-containing protein n=1 Tax=Salinibacter ruber TaxID=146919 RepID=UPI002072A867|nr:FHA domain-containing protein [Salinibacter ruber]
MQDIQNSPGEFEDEVVEIRGFVTEYREDDVETTRFYYLKDRYGDIIMVRTTRGLPTVGERYRVSGPVSIDPEMNRPYVSEESRAQLSGAATGGDASEEGATQETGGESAGGDGTTGGGGISLQTLLFVAIGVVVLLLFGLLIYVLYQRRQPQVATQGGSSLSADTPPPSGGQAGSQQASGQQAGGDGTARQASSGGPEPEEVVQDKTVKMHVPPEGTLKFLGSLEVVAGLDDIDRIPLHRPPGQNGQEAEITIGRTSGPPYEHVELKPRTVSSKQAKLVHDGDCKVVNYASKESNPTRVNGEPMELNESVEIEDGDVLTMGEVKLRYSDGLV